MTPVAFNRLAVVLLVGVHSLAAIYARSARADGPVPPETVPIPGTTFTMGTPIEDKRNPKYHDDEASLTVTVKDFRIGKFPITADQMCQFLNSPEAVAEDRKSLYNHEDIGDYTYSTIELTEGGKYRPRPKAAKAPANQVTWKGAAMYCRWLSEKTDNTYRLPTEAEWELAARGKELRTWPWGGKSPTAKMGARFDYSTMPNSAELADRQRKGEPTWETVAVGSHPANATPEGVHDMLGYIIGEWCANKYVENPSAKQVVGAHMDVNDMASDRVVRGYFHRPHSRRPLIPLGDWPLHGGRTWTRFHAHPIDAVQHAARYGFRVAEGGGLEN